MKLSTEAQSATMNVISTNSNDSRDDVSGAGVVEFVDLL